VLKLVVNHDRSFVAWEWMMVSSTGKDADREQRWQGLLVEQEASGHSARQFCQERGLSLPQFYYWRRRLRNGATIARPAHTITVPVPDFVELGSVWPPTPPGTLPNSLPDCGKNNSPPILCAPICTATITEERHSETGYLVLVNSHNLPIFLNSPSSTGKNDISASVA